jgi:hypothetical protein
MDPRDGRRRNLEVTGWLSGVACEVWEVREGVERRVVVVERKKQHGWQPETHDVISGPRVCSHMCKINNRV